MPHRSLTLLLVEQQPLIRSTLVAVARQIELAQIEETASIDIAEQRLRFKNYDGLLLSMDETTRALDLLDGGSETLHEQTRSCTNEHLCYVSATLCERPHHDPSLD